MDDPARPPQDPLIIVGTGRCGSTLLHRMLAEHEALGWLSTFNEVFPRRTWLAACSRLYRLPLPGRIREARWFPKPFEAYRFWEHFQPGFSRRDRPQTPDDVDPGAIGSTRAATASVLRHQGRRRLLVKVTGWSRIGYFDRIYPGARFVALDRDPRAVVSSWMKADWLDLSSAPDAPGWQWGPVPDAYMRAWRELGGDPVLSTALKIRLDLDDIALNAARIPERVHDLSYEELVREPEPSLRRLCEFAGLPWTERFARTVENRDLFDSSATWRRHLSEEDGERVLELIRRTGDAGPVAAADRSHG